MIKTSVSASQQKSKSPKVQKSKSPKVQQSNKCPKVQKKSPKEWLILYAKGLAMGASDVVPGVSGGTIAFITGIYERLINAVKQVNLANLKLVFEGKWRMVWKNIDGAFLVCLLAGVGTSFLTLAKLITSLLDSYPTLVWSFFFGLIIASTIFVGKQVKWKAKTLAAFVFFTVLSFLITSPQNHPLQSDSSYWYIFLCGAIAICAMILPGISGSFILVLLGQYAFMMQVIGGLQIKFILIFLCGALVGIVSFSNVLSWLFKHWEMITLASLAGFMFGSLNKIWPWKETLETYTDRHGKVLPLVQKNILPADFDSQFIYALLLVILGIVLILSIEFIAAKTVSNKK
jgi:putative membrane protein